MDWVCLRLYNICWSGKEYLIILLSCSIKIPFSPLLYGFQFEQLFYVLPFLNDFVALKLKPFGLVSPTHVGASFQ